MQWGVGASEAVDGLLGVGHRSCRCVDVWVIGCYVDSWLIGWGELQGRRAAGAVQGAAAAGPSCCREAGCAAACQVSSQGV